MKKTIISLMLVCGVACGMQIGKHVWREERGLSAALPGEKSDLVHYSSLYCDWIHSCHGYDEVASGIPGQVDGLYQLMFPGTVIHLKAVTFGSTASQLPGSLGVTSIMPKKRTNYVPIGEGSENKVDVSVKVFDPTDWDTIVHESSHAANASLRGNPYSFHFFDEGMAVMVSWVLDSAKEESDAQSMAFIARNYSSPSDLKQFYLSRFPEVPPGDDYAVAGFFMVQVYDLCGAETVKYLITTDRHVEAPEHVYNVIKQAAWDHGHMDEDAFWKTMEDRMQEWVR